ncbi:hypothetical protein ACQJBY_048644 [Aegilops geniculata]
MVISCQAQISARKTAKIGLDLIHLFKKASHVLMGCLCSKGAKDHADATSENREPSSKDDPKTASGTNDGSKVMPYAGEKVVVAFDARFSSCNNAELKGLSGEHVVSGWPTWLANVAPKAVQGWLPRRADSFEKLDKIGQGTYSIVYKARDLETGKIVALKKVRFVNMDPESVRFMAREIHILRRLDHPNIIKLEGIVTSRVSQSLYLVFEYMEHDLSGLIASPGLKLTESQVVSVRLLH